MKKTLAKVLALALCAVLLVTGTVFVTLAYLQGKSDVVKNTFTSAGVNLILNETKVNSAGKPVDKNGNVLVDDNDDPIKGPDGNPVSFIREGILTNEYELVPGQTYMKDPKITVLAKSVPSYIFIAVLDTMFQSGNDAETESDAAGNPITFEETLLDDDTNKDEDTGKTRKGLISEQLKNNGWVKMDSAVIGDEAILAALGDNWYDNAGNALYTVYYYTENENRNDGLNDGVVDATAGDIVLDIFDEFTILEEVKELSTAGKSLEIIALGVQAHGFTDAEAAWTTAFFGEGAMGS